MKPSDVVGNPLLGMFGCVETEAAMHRAIEYLAANGDTWDKPIPRPTTRDEAWDWDHHHPTLYVPSQPPESALKQYCQFHVRCLDVYGALRPWTITRLAERLGFTAAP